MFYFCEQILLGSMTIIEKFNKCMWIRVKNSSPKMNSWLFRSGSVLGSVVTILQNLKCLIWYALPKFEVYLAVSRRMSKKICLLIVSKQYLKSNKKFSNCVYTPLFQHTFQVIKKNCTFIYYFSLRMETYNSITCLHINSE